MKRSANILLYLLLVVGLSPAASLCAGEVQGLRIWAGPDKTRAVLDLDGSVSYRVFQLSNPERVVVDIDRASAVESLGRLPEDTGVLASVRHGIRDGDHLRIVLDLKQQVEPRSFLLAPAGEYGHRLVIDLHPGDAVHAGLPVKSARDYQPEPNRDVVVAIDAGHGGEDPGAIGPRKTREKDVTLAIARELKREIDARQGMRAVLVREGDYYIPHRDRFEMARRERADLFVSVHADAFTDRRVTGSSVFVLSERGASSESARRLAEKENRADLIGGVTLNDKDSMLASVLMDLSQTATQEASNNVAHHVFQQLKQVGKTHKRAVERANFLVLKSPDVPSILVETAFISNPDEEKRLNDRNHQRKLAANIADGVLRHFQSMPPPGTWMASNRLPPTHIVARGDTLSGIASRYQVSMSELRAANNLKSSTIHVGSQLVIPTG